MIQNKKIVYAVAVIVLLAMFLVAYSQMFSESKTNARKREQIYSMYQSYKKEFPDVQEVGPQAAVELVNTGKVVFIDVREADEQSVSRLPGAISADFFLENIDNYHNFIKIGYSTISYRSGIFARDFHQQGIPMYNLRGGILGWVHAGGKVYNGAAETRRIHVYSREWDLVPEDHESVW